MYGNRNDNSIRLAPIPFQLSIHVFVTLTKPEREFIKRSYKHSDVIFWNQLPNEAKLTEPMHSFREHIKTNRDLPCHNIS